MHEGNNMDIMTTLKKPTLERPPAGGALLPRVPGMAWVACPPCPRARRGAPRCATDADTTTGREHKTSRTASGLRPWQGTQRRALRAIQGLLAPARTQDDQGAGRASKGHGAAGRARRRPRPAWGGGRGVGTSSFTDGPRGRQRPSSRAAKRPWRLGRWWRQRPTAFMHICVAGETTRSRATRGEASPPERQRARAGVPAMGIPGKASGLWGGVGGVPLGGWPQRNARARGFFACVHHASKRGKALRQALLEWLVTEDPGIQYEPLHSACLCSSP